MVFSFTQIKGTRCLRKWEIIAQDCLYMGVRAKAGPREEEKHGAIGAPRKI
jgi:hypothetical protein